MVKRVAGHVLRILIGVAVTVLVAVAVLVGVARQFVSGIHEMQPQVAEYLSQQSGRIIGFDDLQGSWKGLAPRFRLRNVYLSQTADQPPAIVARSLDLEILLLSSLLNLQPRVRLTVDGAILTLVQHESHMSVEGLTMASPAGGGGGMKADVIADLLSAQPRMQVTDSRVVVKGWYDEPVVLNVQRLQGEAGRALRYMTGDVVLQGPTQLAFQLRAKLRGSFLASDSLTGEVYLDTAYADWLPWIPPEKRHFRQVELASLQGGNEIWLQLKRGVLADATARFVLHEFNLHSDNEIQPPLIKRLSGVARWQRLDDGGWQAGIEDFSMVTPRFNWQPSVLSLSATPTDDGTRYGLALDDADITPWLNYFLSTQPAEGKLYDTLKALRPAGKLQRLSLFMLHKDNFLQDIRLAARVEQFNSRAWEKYPGFRDLDLDIWARDDLYILRLNDDYLELNYPWLFRDTLVLKHMAGALTLTKQEDGFLVQSAPLHLNTDDVRTATQFSLQLPFDKSVPPFMQLQSTLRDVNASEKSRYLPAGVIPPKLLAWLDDAILAGKLVRGDIVVHGNLGPDQIPNRRILLGFSVQDAELRFLPDWEEPVRNADADVIVDRGGVQAVVTRGEYFGQTLASGTVDVPRVPSGSQHVLNVKVQTQGPADTGFAILQKTPLAKLSGNAVVDMALAGEMGVTLDLTVPLAAGEQKTVANVDVELQQGQFRLQSRNLQVDELEAQVHFDLVNGLSASSLTGKTLGGTVTGAIATTPFKQGGQITALSMNGTATVAALQDWLKLSVLEPLSGKAPYQVQMELPLGDARRHKHASLNITSSLKGTAVNLPAPFGKTAKAGGDFRVWMSLDRTPSLLGVRYGKLFELSTQSREGRLQKGVLTLGGEKAVLPGGNHFVVQGSLPRFATAEWLPVFNRIKAASSRHGENLQASSLGLLDQSRLSVSDLVLGERSLGRQQLALRRQGDGWVLDLQGDFLQGSAQLPAYVLENPASFARQSTPVIVQLTRVMLPGDAEETEAESAATTPPVPEPEPPFQPVDFSPLSLPAADITIEHLLLGEDDFGRWSLKLRPRDNGSELLDVSVKMRGIDFSGRGWWRDVNGERSSALAGDFRADDIANVMRGWGSEPTMSSKKMNGKLDWQWPGAPFEFAVKRTRGNINLKLEDGSFYNVKSGVVGKFWGALNFETLLRRLQLNFKDLQEKEMVYDEISARAQINNGVLRLNELQLESPAIRLQTQGNIDLPASQMDLVMNVTVPVTRNLVLPAAVVGGVPAAAAVWAVEKVLGSQFDKLTTIKYSVKGSFDAPDVTVMESFNIIPDKVSETVISGDKKGSSTPPGEPAKP